VRAVVPLREVTRLVGRKGHLEVHEVRRPSVHIELITHLLTCLVEVALQVGVVRRERLVRRLELADLVVLGGEVALGRLGTRGERRDLAGLAGQFGAVATLGHLLLTQLGGLGTRCLQLTLEGVGTLALRPLTTLGLAELDEQGRGLGSLCFQTTALGGLRLNARPELTDLTMGCFELTAVTVAGRRSGVGDRTDPRNTLLDPVDEVLSSGAHGVEAIELAVGVLAGDVREEVVQSQVGVGDARVGTLLCRRESSRCVVIALLGANLEAGLDVHLGY